jgi:hypothetical protein
MVTPDLLGKLARIRPGLAILMKIARLMIYH